MQHRTHQEEGNTTTRKGERNNVACELFDTRSRDANRHTQGKSRGEQQGCMRTIKRGIIKATAAQ